MYRSFFIFLTSLYSANCASYQRYDQSTPYPSYSTYSTISNLYNQYPFKGNYGNDLASFPEATRYPNYSPGYTTSRSYTYPNQYMGSNYQQGYPGYSTPRYGEVYGSGYSPYEMPFMKNRGYCVNRSPQSGIWVDSLNGIWYGVEFIQHLAGDSRVDYAKTCIVIHIAEPSDQPSTETQLFHVQTIKAKFKQEYRHLRLLWDEAGHTIEYTLYFRNESAGYWQALNRQNGTLTSRPSYQQFSGTIQVLKAVHDHLVLSFCQEGTDAVPAQLYTVLFSREPGVLARWEIDAVHTLLQNKKLSVASRRMVCGNGADKPIYGIVFSIITCVIAYAISS